MDGFVNDMVGEWMCWGDEWLYVKAGKILCVQVHLRRRIGGKIVAESSKENEFSELGESARRLFAQANFVSLERASLCLGETLPETYPLERTLGELERTCLWLQPLERTLGRLEQRMFWMCSLERN